MPKNTQRGVYPSAHLRCDECPSAYRRHTDNDHRAVTLDGYVLMC